MNLNKVFILGRVTQEPETKTTPSGSMVANFNIATNRYWTDAGGNKQEKTDYHRVVAWRRLAELIQQYVNKGSLILIEGRVETRSYDDREGVKRYITEIIADAIQLGPRSASVASRQNNPAAVNDTNSAPKASPAPAPAQKEEDIPTIDVNIDDVPF